MQIDKIMDIENRSDGTKIKEILFDQLISKEFIEHLSSAGNLEYYTSFETPFFKIDNKGAYLIKGIEGNDSVRLILKNNSIQSLKDFKNLVKDYKIYDYYP